MSAPSLPEGLSALISRLVEVVQNDPELRKQIRDVLVAMDRADEPDPGSYARSRTQDLDGGEQYEGTAAQASPEPIEPGSEGDLPLAEELALIEDRCRLKAEGARWAVERERLLSEGCDYESEIQPKDRVLIGRAREVQDCFLWMNHPRGPHPDDPSLFDALAESFEVLGEAASLLAAVLPFTEAERQVFEQTLELAAEGQSAVRAAVMQLQGDEWADPDQERMFRMLRELTRAHSVYVSRHMRLDDPADPFDWEVRASRILDLEESLGEKPSHRKDRRRLLIQYRSLSLKLHAVDDPDTPTFENFIEALDGLVKDGLAYSCRALRLGVEPLMGRLESLNGTAEHQEHLSKIIREIELHRLRQDQAQTQRAGDNAPAAGVFAPEVDEVADLLNGRKVVYIGGELRENAKRALESAFGLARLIWLDMELEGDAEAMESEISRPDVALVLASTRYAEDVETLEELCGRFDKPLVELPGGYHPNQVAIQITDQAIEQL